MINVIRRVMACSAIALATSFSSVAQEPRPVRVLVDRSHEWLFAHDDLAERMLRPAGFEVVLCDASLDSKMKLQDFDVVLVQQTANAFEFSDQEIARLKDYVERGGRLAVVGNPACPVRKLAAAFGFTLRPQPCRLPLRCEPWLCASWGAEAELRTRPMACCVEGAGSVKKLITDQDGVPVAVLKELGRGQVLGFADDGAYWDFCAQRDKNLRVPNVPTTVALFQCLVPDRPLKGPGPAVVRIPAEQELDLGPLLVRYSDPVADRAQVLLGLLPRVSAFVAKANAGEPPTEQFTVNILASGGGGWSGGQEIGVQCGGPVAANVAVIAHELTHSWTGPLPGILGEGWASMVGMRAAGALGFTKEADDERRTWAAQITAFEKDGQKLDITLADRDRRLFGASEAKMMRMIEQLEAEHGADFMPRFLELCHALKGSEAPTLQEVLYYFSLVAGADLAPAHQQLGTTVQRPPPIPPEELQRKLAAYRARTRLNAK
jgi:hypothetical protein